MKANRKPPAAGSGRRKGNPNKITHDVRACIALAVEANGPKLQGWIDRVARKNPAKACEIHAKLCEFIVPRLLRTELRLPGDAMPPPSLGISWSNGGPGLERVIDAPESEWQEPEQAALEQHEPAAQPLAIEPAQTQVYIAAPRHEPGREPPLTALESHWAKLAESAE